MLRVVIAVLALSLGTLAQAAPDDPVANPARPTIATPATLTPVGYLQFETGFLYATHSPAFSSQSSFNEIMKIAVSPRIEFLAGDMPFARSTIGNHRSNATGDVVLGAQGVVHMGEGANPSIALSYFRRVYEGDAPDLDIGSFRNSALLLASADVAGFHYDANFLVNEVVDNARHRVQTGQTISISHPLTSNLGATGEIWHFTQPLTDGHAVGTLWALNYNLRKNLVFDAGFDRGLTCTSTRWQLFAGFTYLVPHKLLAP